MTQDAILALFQKHDTYVKSLKMIPLAPFITNIDTLRTEQFETGEKIDRSTREWASALALPNSDTSTVKCDVVNGGYDQKAYLLISQIHYDFVISELAAYKKRVFPFSKREEQFRASIGPPEVIHITDNKIRANLSIFDSLSEAASPIAAKTNPNGDARPQQDQNSMYSSASQSSTSSVSASIDLQSHRQQNSTDTPRSRQNQTNTSRSFSHDDRTSTIGASSHSWNATSISSTNQARFHELDAIMKRQRKITKNLVRSQMIDSVKWNASQFHRLETIENAVTESKASQVVHTERLQSLETQVVQFMEQQVDMGQNILSVEDKINSLISIVNNIAINSQNKEDNTSQETHKQKSGKHIDDFRQPSSILELVDTDMASNPSTSSDESSSFQTTCSVPSPEKKKVRASPLSQATITP